MKRILKNKKMVFVFIVFAVLLSFNIKADAALESKKGQTSVITTVNNNFIAIRNMETSGQTLGLTANLASTSYLDTTGNGLDVHLALSTEWGTVALLAISDYGAFVSTVKVDDDTTDIAATTGNITGVFQMANSRPEYAAGLLTGGSNSSTSTLYAADSRYYNLYTEDATFYHKGDAIYQTSGWYGATYMRHVKSGAPIFYRASPEGRLFSFYENSGGVGQYANGAVRAAIVCGARIIINDGFKCFNLL